MHAGASTRSVDCKRALTERPPECCPMHRPLMSQRGVGCQHLGSITRRPQGCHAGGLAWPEGQRLEQRRRAERSDSGMQQQPKQLGVAPALPPAATAQRKARPVRPCDTKTRACFYYLIHALLGEMMPLCRTINLGAQRVGTNSHPPACSQSRLNQHMFTHPLSSWLV